MYDSHERLTPNTLDSRELQEKANEQLHSIKLQQVMLQNRAKQWIQQQQQQQQVSVSTVKLLKIRTAEKHAVIILKLELNLFHFTTE